MKTDDKHEQGSAPMSSERPMTEARLPYAPPRLAVWGSLVDLTGGPIFDVADADFGGSGGG